MAISDGSWVTWPFLVAVLVLVALSALIWARFATGDAKEEFDTAVSRSPARHFWSFLLWVALVLAVVVILVLVSGAAFPLLRGTLFNAEGEVGGLQAGDVLSILALLTGVPIAFAGSIYAIYLAILGLRGSSDQKRLAEQANKFSDPAYDLSQRAYNGYRRFGFLTGALLAASRIERQARENAAYEGQTAMATGAASEIVSQMHDLLFDEAFSVAALEAAKCHGRRKPSVGERTAEHRLRSAFAHLIGLLEGVKGLALDANTMTPLMAGVHGLDLQIKLGREAVVEQAGSEEGVRSDDDDRFLMYLANWMGRIGDAEVGGDLEKNARALFIAERFFGKVHEARELVGSYLDDMLNNPNKLGQKTSVTVPIVPAVRVRASLGDFQLIDALTQLAKEVGKTSKIAVHTHEFNRYEPPQDGPAGLLHVLSCSMDRFESVVKEIPLHSGFIGILLVDGIRSEDSIRIERDVTRYEQEWARLRAENGVGVAPSRPVVLVDVMKGLQPNDRIEKTTLFQKKYRQGASEHPGRLLLVGVDYFEPRTGGDDRCDVESLFKVEHIFAQNGSGLTDELKRIAGL